MGWSPNPNTDFVELVFDVNVPTSDQPPIAAILNLNPVIKNPGTNFVSNEPFVIETGLFELHGVAYHKNVPDQNVRYKLDLYRQSGTADGWQYAGPVRIVGKTPLADDFFHGQVMPDPNNFGDIDLTVFENGLYNLVLTVQVPGNYGGLADRHRQRPIHPRLPAQDRPGQIHAGRPGHPCRRCPCASSALTTASSAIRTAPFGCGWTYTIAAWTSNWMSRRTTLMSYMDDEYDIQSVRISDIMTAM